MNGLPASKLKKSKIIIVGAGMSGMTAGKYLREAGHEVVILEASSRVGGRVQTYRDLRDGWRSEIGPMRIPKTHIFTLELARRLGLTLTKFDNREGPYHFYIREKKLRMQDLEKFNLLQFSKEYDATAPLRNVTGGKPVSPGELVAAAMEEPLSDLQRLPWAQFLRKYDSYSLKDWLVKQGISRGAIDMIGVFYNFEAFLDMSLVENTIDECVFHDPQLKKVEEGMDMLPKGLYRDVDDLVRFNSRVYRVEHGITGVTVK